MACLSNLACILEKIKEATRQTGRLSPPELVAVSKSKSAEEIAALFLEGQKVFAENYVQELIGKIKELEAKGLSGFEFHFIGHLQTNKVKAILPFVSTIHSVDSLRLLQEIDSQARNFGKKISVYFQVNIDEEKSKGGFLPQDLSELSSGVQEKELIGICPLGLMAIPNPIFDVSPSFQKMQKLAKQFERTLGPGLSMGMSNDFELAIKYGASSIRLGTILMGARKII